MANRSRMFGGLRGQFIVAVGAILAVGISVVVLVSQNTLNLDPGLQQAIITPLLVSVGALTLVFSYAFFTYSVMRPLRAIDVSTRRAANGDFASPVNLIPKSEFGDLGENFNGMLQEIEKQRALLEKQLVDLKAANAQLLQTQDSLIRSERLASVGQLAAGVAHEIGNPLAAVQGFVDLIDDDLTDEERDDILKRVGLQLDRIRATIRNLLDFSRNDDHPSQPTDLAGCIDETLKLVKAMPKARGIAFVIEPTININNTSVANVQAQAVPNRVVQLLLNLTLNAIDAIKSEKKFGTVTFRVVEDWSHVRLRVSDDGPGVDPALAESIFDPFFTTKEAGHGTGLGLAIVHRMMSTMEGEIELEPSESGATFLLSFPLAERRLYEVSEEE